MGLDAERFQTHLEFCVRWFNNFCFEKEFYIKDVSILLQVHRDNVGSLEDLSFYYKRSLDIPKEITRASRQFSSIMSFEEPQLRLPRGESVTKFPLNRVTFNSFNLWRGGHLAAWRVGHFVHPPHYVCDVSVVVDLYALIDFSFSVAFSDCDEDKKSADLQLGVQIDFFDFTSNERISRGTKRAFSIGWTLARDAVSRQLRPIGKFKGVRLRHGHNDSRPWNAWTKTSTGKKLDLIDCSTEVLAALASDVGTVYFGKGEEALNFEETRRLVEKVSEDLKEENQKDEKVREQVRLLTKNPLVCLIYDLSEELFDLDISLNFKTQGDELYFLLIELIRLVRKKNEAAVSASQPADIPQLLESINQILKRNVAPTGVSGHWYHRLIGRFLSRLPPIKAFAKHCSLVPHFIRWVETEVVKSRQLSRSSLSPTEIEDPPVDISSGCNTLIGHFPHLHEKTQDTLEHGSRDSLSSEHGTFQAATPNNQGAIMGIRPSTNNCGDQTATTILSSLVPAMVEPDLLPFPISNVETTNEGCHFGVTEFLEDLQDDHIFGDDLEDHMQLNFDEMRGTCRRGLDTQPTSSISMPKHFQVDQATTTLSSPVPTVGEIMLFPSHHSTVEVANHIFQIGTPEHLEILQDSEDRVQLSDEKMEWSNGNKGLDTRPINKGPGFQTTSMLVASSECHSDFPFTLDQPATTLSSPVPTIGETLLFPSLVSNVEIARDIFQIGTSEPFEVLQNDCIWVEDSRDPMQMSSEKMRWTIGSEGLDTQQRIEGSNFQMTPMLVTSFQSQHDFPFTFNQDVPMLLPSPIPNTIKSTMLPISSIQSSILEIAKEGLQDGVLELLEDLQDDHNFWELEDNMPVSSQRMQWNSGSEGLYTQLTNESSPQDGDAPIQMATTTSPLLNAVHVKENLLQQFMDSDDGEDLTSLLVTAGPDHHESILKLLTQSEQTLRHNLGGCNLDIDGTELASITSQLLVQMATTSPNAGHVKENPLQQFMDSDDGEDLTSLLVTAGPDQHESVLELLTQHEQTLRRNLDGCNLDMGTKSTSITSHPDGNQIDSLDMHLSLAEPSEMAQISSHMEGNQIDPLDMHLSLAEPSEMASISSHMEGNQIDPLDMHLSLAKPSCHPTFSQQSFVQFDEYLFQ